MFAYCGNNPVVYTDPTGEGRLKELENVLNLFAGGFQVAAGLALGATVGWTGIGAVAAGFLIVDGLAVSLQGAGKIINDVTNSNFLREDNVVRTGVQELGKMVGGETGAIIAGSLYDIAGMAAGLYPVVISLQLAGKLPVRVKVNSLVPNPNNPMTDEGINYWTRTLSQNGFKGYNTLPNAYGVVEPICVQQGTMLITNGHHRVAVLSKYGVEVIKVYFVP